MTDQSAPSEVPPGLFFQAKDLGKKPRVDNGTSAHDVETGRRNSQIGRCLARVEQLAKDLRSLKSFDEMGNIEAAAGQVECRLDDTADIIENLLHDIEQAAARYRRDHGVESKSGGVPSPVPADAHASAEWQRPFRSIAKGGRL